MQLQVGRECNCDTAHFAIGRLQTEYVAQSGQKALRVTGGIPKGGMKLRRRDEMKLRLALLRLRLSAKCLRYNEMLTLNARGTGYRVRARSALAADGGPDDARSIGHVHLVHDTRSNVAAVVKVRLALG